MNRFYRKNDHLSSNVSFCTKLLYDSSREMVDQMLPVVDRLSEDQKKIVQGRIGFIYFC